MMLSGRAQLSQPVSSNQNAFTALSGFEMLSFPNALSMHTLVSNANYDGHPLKGLLMGICKSKQLPKSRLFLQPTPVQVLCRNNLLSVTFKIINFAVSHLHASSTLTWHCSHICISSSDARKQLCTVKGLGAVWKFGSRQHIKADHEFLHARQWFSEFHRKWSPTSLCLKIIPLLMFKPYIYTSALKWQ